MLKEAAFQVFSLGFTLFAILFIVGLALVIAFFLDRIWPSRPYAVRNWEHIAGLGLITLVIVLVT